MNIFCFTKQNSFHFYKKDKAKQRFYYGLPYANYGAPCVKLRNLKFCIIFWLNCVQYHILLQFIYIAAICVKLLQFMYIAAICVNCCNLSTLQKNL